MALSYSFNANAGETPESVAQQRLLAQQLAGRIFGRTPANVGEGLNMIGQALIARQMMNSADDAQKAGMATAWQGGQTSPFAPTGDVPASLAAPVAQTDTTGKIYSNNEPSPLDPPSGADRQAMMQTILGEAGNQGPTGENAVASVIRNRAVNGGYGGNTPSSVVTAPNQFEPWNTQAGRTNMATAAADPRQAAAADAAIRQAYGEGGQAPNDPTNGAVNFIAPQMQTALGRPMPAWAQGPGQDIGDHRFFGSPAAPTQVAQAGSPTMSDGGGAALPPNAQPAQGALPTSPGGPFPALPNDLLVKQAANPWNPAPLRQLFAAEITRRATAAQQAADPLRQLQIKKAQQDTESQGKFGVIGEDSLGRKQYGFVDPTSGQVTPYKGPGAGSDTGGGLGNMDLTGKEYLASIPVAERGTVQGMVEGTIAPPSSFALSKPYWQNMIAAAKNVDPTFDAANWSGRLAGVRDFSAGKSSEMVRSANQTLHHVGQLLNSMDDLNNGSFTPYNYVSNMAQEVTGGGAQGAFRTNAHAVAEELSKVFKGSNLSDTEIKSWEQNLNENMSPEQQRTQVAKLRDLLQGSLQALEEKRLNSIGPMAAEKQGPLIKDEGQRVLARIDKWIKDGTGAAQGTTPGTAGPKKVSWSVIQ